MTYETRSIYRSETNDPIINSEIYKNTELEDRQTAVLKAQSELICVPELIRKSFSENGYWLILVPDENLSELFDVAYAGINAHSEKTIYIRIFIHM